MFFFGIDGATKSTIIIGCDNTKRSRAIIAGKAMPF